MGRPARRGMSRISHIPASSSSTRGAPADEASGGPCGRWPIAVASCAFTSAVESKSSRSMSHAADWERWRKRGIPLADDLRSEEHTSELQSRFDLVCRLLLEKKKTNYE